MSNFSGFTENTFVNGTTPAINAANLNKNEAALADVMGELNYSDGWGMKQYLMHALARSTKMVEDCETAGDWSTTGTVALSTEYTVPFGHSGLKATETDNVSGAILLTQTFGTTKDLSTFDSGDSSPTSDIITVLFYVSDDTLVDYVRIRLGDDASNYYWYNMSYSTGWNTANLTKSAFSTNGTPTGWNAIDYGALYWYAKANAINEYVTFAKVIMTRKDGVTSLPNPFILDDGVGSWDIRQIENTTSFIAFLDSKTRKPVIQQTFTGNIPTNLEIFCTVNSFCVKAELWAKEHYQAGGIQWYQDANNYLYIGVYNSSLIIYEYVSGSGTVEVTAALDDFIIRYERMELIVEKNGDQIRAQLLYDGQPPVFADYITTIGTDTAGCVGFCSYDSAGRYAISDFVVGHNRSALPPFMGDGLTLFKKKSISETVTSSATMQYDDDLYLRLPAYQTFEINAWLAVTGATAGDFRCEWDATNTMEQVTTRSCLGAGIGVASGDGDDTSVRVSRHNLTTDVTYGLDNTRTLFINERFVVLTGSYGGYIHLKWAQRVSDGTGTIVSANSYMLAKKL